MKKLIIIIVVITLTSCLSVEKSADKFMSKANKKKTLAGCYFVQGDSVVYKKNHD